MKQLIKRSLVIAIVFSLIIFSVSSYAITPRWSYLSSITASIDIDDGIATISASCDAVDSNVTKTKIKCELQKYDDSWSTIKTWTVSDNEVIVSMEKTYAVASGYDYRLKVTGYAYNGSTLLESATEYFD